MPDYYFPIKKVKIILGENNPKINKRKGASVKYLQRRRRRRRSQRQGNGHFKLELQNSDWYDSSAIIGLGIHWNIGRPLIKLVQNTCFRFVLFWSQHLNSFEPLMAYIGVNKKKGNRVIGNKINVELLVVNGLKLSNQNNDIRL